MKKVMWIISILSVIITAITLQFMPDTVPMHYNMAGEIDRWGSKYENFLFPIILIVITLFWQLLILHFEKKAVKTTVEKEQAELVSNVKVLKVVGVSMACVFTVMQGFFLYSAYVEAITDASGAYIDINKLTCILCGVLFIVIGNFMPKTKKNHVAGVRIKWSMYNDITWMKSNRFGAAAMVITGVLIVVTSACIKESAALLCMMAYIIIDVIIELCYSYKVYKEELAKEEHE